MILRARNADRPGGGPRGAREGQFLAGPAGERKPEFADVRRLADELGIPVKQAMQMAHGSDA